MQDVRFFACGRIGNELGKGCQGVCQTLSYLSLACICQGPILSPGRRNTRAEALIIWACLNASRSRKFDKGDRKLTQKTDNFLTLNPKLTEKYTWKAIVKYFIFCCNIQPCSCKGFGIIQMLRKKNQRSDGMG